MGQRWGYVFIVVRLETVSKVLELGSCQVQFQLEFLRISFVEFWILDFGFRTVRERVRFLVCGVWFLQFQDVIICFILFFYRDCFGKCGIYIESEGCLFVYLGAGFDVRMTDIGRVLCLSGRFCCFFGQVGLFLELFFWFFCSFRFRFDVSVILFFSGRGFLFLGKVLRLYILQRFVVENMVLEVEIGKDLQGQFF